MSNLLLNFQITDFSKNHIYSDLAAPVRYDSNTNDIEPIYDLECIKNSIRNLFNWEVGERILIPAYGNSLKQILYSKMTKLTEKNISANIIQMFKYEPRVEIRDIRIFPDPENNQYNVTIIYTVPRLNRQDEISVVLQIVE